MKRLIGETIVSIVGAHVESRMITILTESGKKFIMYHRQNCCENVELFDIIGDMENLIGSPITLAEEVTSHDKQKEQRRWPESFTWTFYKFATVKGYVTLRWFGSSNGYYSESVTFEEDVDGDLELRVKEWIN